MARSDRTGINAVLDRARRFALAVETQTSLVPLPAPAPIDEAEQRMALYDALILDGSLRQATRKLFRDGYFAQAVSEACKVVNNTVKKKSGAADKDGTSMMMAVFDRSKPILKLNKLKTVTDGDEQEGYKFIFAGLMLGVRNPRAHEHDLRDEPQAALEMLTMVNHLLRVLGGSKRRKVRKAKEPTSG